MKRLGPTWFDGLDEPGLFFGCVVLGLLVIGCIVVALLL